MTDQSQQQIEGVLSKMAPHRAARPAWDHLQRQLARLADQGETPPCHDDPDTWHDPDAEVAEAAAHRCRPCPVKAACRDYGVAGERTGVWGGTNVARLPSLQRRRPATRDSQGDPT